MTPIINMQDFGKAKYSDNSSWEVTIDGYRYELFSNGFALVYKGDSVKPTYEIDTNGCNCPSAAYGRRPCKHEKPLTFKGDDNRNAGDEEDISSWSDVTELLE